MMKAIANPSSVVCTVSPLEQVRRVDHAGIERSIRQAGHALGKAS
jgi:hypothetical protein